MGQVDLFPAISATGEVVYATHAEATALTREALQRLTARLLGMMLQRIVRALLNPAGQPVPSPIILAQLAVLVEQHNSKR